MQNCTECNSEFYPRPIQAMSSLKKLATLICDDDNLFIWDCNTNIKLSHSFPRHEQFSQDRLPGPVGSVVFDSIQNLVVVVSLPGICIVTGAEQCRHIFSMEFRLVSSLLPNPDSGDTSLECQHSLEDSGHYHVFFNAGARNLWGLYNYPLLHIRHSGVQRVHTSDRLEERACEERKFALHLTPCRPA